MKQIALTQGKFAIVDNSDYGMLSQFKWQYLPAGNGYAKRAVQIKLEKHKYKVITVLMHRLILNAPEGVEIDHINRNSLDNRRCNLRICDRSTNMLNREGWAKKKVI